MDIVSQHIIDLGILAGLTLTAGGSGRLLLLQTGIPFASLGENAIFATAVGFGALSYAVFLLGAFHLLYAISIYVLLGLFFILAVFGWFTSRRTIAAPPLPKNIASNFDRIAGILLLIALIADLLFVLTPAVGKDALSYHLAVPRQYLSFHGFYFIPGNLFSNYPLNGEMAFMIGLALRGDILAKGIHYVMALLTLSGVWLFTKQHTANTSFVFLPMLIFFTIPSVFLNAHLAYTDITLTCYVFLAVFAYVNWLNRHHSGWLVLSAVFTGFAASTKYSGLFLPFLGCLGIFCASRNNRWAIKRALYFLGLYLAVTIIIGSPFYIKNWIFTGNPFYPFFYAIFGGKGWDLEQARVYDLFLQNLGMGRRLLDYLLLPWNISFHSQMNSPRFDGVLGPIFILTLPFAVGIRNMPLSVKVSLTCAGFMFLFWAGSAQQIRYLLAVFPFLAITTGYIVSYYLKRKPVFAVLILIVVTGLVINGYHIAKDFNKIKPLRYITGHEDRDAFLSRVIPSYGMFRHINTHLPEDTKLFFIYMKNLGFLCDRNYYSDSMLESYTLQKILKQSQSSEDVFAFLNEKGFTHILYDIRYILGKYSTFSEKESALFLTFQNKFLKLIKSDKNIYYLYRIYR